MHLQGPALDVLAQQIVAEAACREWAVDELFALVRRAWPRTASCRARRSTRSCRCWPTASRPGAAGRPLHVHYDAVNGKLRGRAGARLTAITNGGAIPDQFDYDVVLLPEEVPIGTLNEDFAFESLPGDIFQLGNTSYRIMKVETGRVLVQDARGQPPNIPFWFGEAPGRSDELSEAVSRLREQVAEELELGEDRARDWLEQALGLSAIGERADRRISRYRAQSRSASCRPGTRSSWSASSTKSATATSSFIPSYGSRINRAWGLALRKRFCRKFNYELQAAALEDSIVISLGPVHSFPLAEVIGYLKPETVRQVLVQALLAAPMFPTRWRWVATTSLALRRFRNGKKVPPQFQRSDAEDLLAVVFPDQIACAENIVGDRRGAGSPAGGADAARLPARADGHRGAGGAAPAHRRRRGPHRDARRHDTVAAGPGDPDRAALRVPRRCAGRGAAHPGRAHAPPARSRRRLQSGASRSRRDRARLPGGLARSAQCRRAARCAGAFRFHHRGGGRPGAIRRQ